MRKFPSKPEARLKREAVKGSLDEMQTKLDQARPEKEAQQRKQFEEHHIDALKQPYDLQQQVDYSMLRNGGTDSKSAREPVDVESWDFHNEAQQG